MRTGRSLRHLGLACIWVLPFGAPAAHALLNLDGNRSQVFVFGHVNVTHDSNIYADNSGRDDTQTSASLGLEFIRRRGVIGVNSTAKVDFIRFGRFTDENTANPEFSLQLSKANGRTTGDFELRAYRASRADSAINLRTTSWNYPLALNIRYPVNEKLYLASASGYVRRDFQDNATLLDATDFSQGFDIFYVYNSRLDLVLGYRLRVTDTSLRRSRDHAVNIGATGGLLPKVNGTVRLGYQTRSGVGQPASGSEGQFTIAAELDWAPTPRLSFAAQASRDFVTTAVGDSVDSFGAMLNATYSFNRRLDLDAGVSYGTNQFISQVPPQRTDDFLAWTAALRYTLNAHVTVVASGSYLQNWSTIALADFDRITYSLDVSSRF